MKTHGKTRIELVFESGETVTDEIAASLVGILRLAVAQGGVRVLVETTASLDARSPQPQASPAPAKTKRRQQGPRIPLASRATILDRQREVMMEILAMNKLTQTGLGELIKVKNMSPIVNGKNMMSKPTKQGLLEARKAGSIELSEKALAFLRP